MMILEVFKRTWSEVRKERNEAKKARKEVKLLFKQIENTLSEINEAYECLRKVYLYLPEDDRKDYVQKTLDLLKFGVYRDQTAYSFYNKLRHDYILLDYSVKMINNYWKAKDWKNVVKVCESLKEEINSSVKKYVKAKKEAED